MKIAVMQPYLFPYIGYFQLFHAVNKFVVFDDVRFKKRGWINRNYILINGQKYLFTVPLSDSSQNKLIKDTKIIEDNKWRKFFLRSIRLSYRKAPFFEEIFPIIECIITLNERSISKFILHSFYVLKEALGLNTEIIPTSAIYNNSELKGQYRILDICCQENANQYINLSGGIGLYNFELFQENAVKLLFLKSQLISYEQFTNNFVPSLSIIDVLMFNGFLKTRKFLLTYSLEQIKP